MNYLLSASILLFAVWPMYHLLLRYSENYSLNRFLLLLTILVVVALPFVSFTSPVPEVTETLQGTIRYVEEASIQPIAAIEDGIVDVSIDQVLPSVALDQASTKWEPISMVYGIGTLLLTLLLTVRLLLLLSLHLRSRLSDTGGYRILHKGASSGQAFTFGKSLYFSADVVDGPDFDHVLAHERIHARQGHSLDVFLSELFLCVFWFHPAAWWLRAKMRANLEFLVDKAVISGGADRRDYQLALVRQSQATHGLALTLPFSEPSLKSRIVRMTGMPEYRVIGAIATVALLFWLGMAAMVVKGTSEEVSYSTFQFDDAALNKEDEPIFATEFLYATYFAQEIPEEIKSFELYFRRLPTPDEYLQIKSILQRIPHTKFNIYAPCNGAPGTYLMQLSHYLKQEAVFRHPLREGDVLPSHFVFALQKRTADHTIPDDLPLDSYGYYQPTIGTTDYNFTTTSSNKKGTDGIGTLFCTDITPRSGEHFVEHHESSTKEDEIAVFINGERFKLLEKPEVKYEDGMQFAGYPETNTWLGVEGKASDPNALPNSLDQMSARTMQPPNAWMACLLGLEDDPKGMVRKVHTPNNPETYIKGMVEGMKTDNQANLPIDRTFIFLNNEQISSEELLESAIPQDAFLQTGWNSNVQGGMYVIQVITD